MLEPDYFARKRAELGMERMDSLASIQALLEEWYPGQCRARSLNKDILLLWVPSAPLASDLRMRQVELSEVIEQRLGLKLARIMIHIA